MKRIRILLLLALGLVIAPIVFLVAGTPSLSGSEAIEPSREIAKALDGAKSVTFVEYAHEFAGPMAELVFSRVTASPQQIMTLRSATSIWTTPFSRGRRSCFDPHHRVEIVRSDGTELHFEVCFGCTGFTLGDHHVISLLPSGDPVFQSFSRRRECLRAKTTVRSKTAS